MFGVPNQIPTSVVTILGGLWAVATFFISNNNYKKQVKSQAYGQAIAAAEEIHEDYFSGVPGEDDKNKHEGWVWTIDGWDRDSSWKKSDRYLKAARDMNVALALIAIHSSNNIARKAFELENIAIRPLGNLERQKDMNDLVTAMKKDLHKFWGWRKVKQQWY